MTPQSTTKFILGVTNDFVTADDKRIKEIFATYANNDPTKETLDREEFFKFYYTSAKNKIENIHENLKNNFIRPDLKKYSEVIEE